MTIEAYEALRAEGYVLAGERDDLGKRADLYLRMFMDSGQRNVFPLIAAHGARWAVGYFRLGRLGGMLMSLPYLLTPSLRRAKLADLAVFADKFKDINRRVCAESYAIFHYTRVHGGSSFIRSVIGDDFADILCESHATAEFSQARREALFLAFFNWEQDTVVGPAVLEAFDNFHWGIIKHMATRTRLAFTYFGKGFSVRFNTFSSKAERICRGLQVYRRAEEVGLAHVVSTLGSYKNQGLNKSLSASLFCWVAARPRLPANSSSILSR